MLTKLGKLDLKKIWPIIVTGILVLCAIIVVVNTFQSPKTVEEKKTRLTYSLKTSFDHKTYGRPILPSPPNPRIYARITDAIRVDYRYDFLPQQPVTNLSETVQITATLGNAQTWQKEILLVPTTEYKENFDLSFNLDSAELTNLAIAISDNVGSGRAPTLVTLTARVHTSATTPAGDFTSDFVQTCNVDLSTSIIEWQRPFTLERKNYWKGLIYEEQGEFSFTAQMKENMLGLGTIRSENPPKPPLLLSPPLSQYPKDTTQLIEMKLFGEFKSDPAAKPAVNDVNIEAIFTGPGGKKYTFPLLDKKVEGNQFELMSTPIDIALLYSLIGSDEGLTLGPSPAYELLIQGNINTVAQSEFGTINETISPALVALIDQKGVTWPEQKEVTKSGEIKETIVVPNNSRPTFIKISLAFLMMTILGLLLAIWRYIEVRKVPVQISPLIEEASRAKAKYKHLLVDVGDLPELPAAGQVIHFDSLDELMKVGDALLKPVLHKAEEERHSYCVIDGSIRYEYVSKVTNRTINEVIT